MADNNNPSAGAINCCEQLSRISVLEASTAQQGTDIAEIKKDIKALNDKVDKHQESMNTELKAIRDVVGDIKTSVAAQSVKIDNLTGIVSKSVAQLDSLDSKVDGMDKTVTLHTQEIGNLKETTASHGQRLTRVEKKVWRIVAAIGAAIFVLQLISTMSSCSDIKHFVKQMIVEEEQVIQQSAQPQPQLQQ